MSNKTIYAVFNEQYVLRRRVMEQSYCPFGVELHALTSIAFGKLSSQYKFNGGAELEESIELYTTFYRQYDQQLGRFGGVDMLAEQSFGINPYQFAFNNPIFFNDPFGDRAQAPPEFRDVTQLFNYILKNGVNSFSSDFTMFEVGDGGAITDTW